MKILIRYLFVAILLLSFAVPSLSEEDITAEDIVKKAEEIMRGQSNKGTMTMTIVNPNWERTLTMDYWEKGKDRSLVKIISPPKEAGTVSLKVENNMWNYLPSVEKVVKIPPSMMMQSWMGSDFTNDDLVKESSIVEDYTPALTGKETIDGMETHMLELTARPEAAVVWGKLILYIRVGDYAPMKYEYYDEKGKLIRVMTMTEISDVDGRPYPHLWTMVPKSEDKKGRKTIIKVEKIEFNVPIDDDVFNLSNLTRGVIPE